MSAASCISKYFTNQNWHPIYDPYGMINFSNRGVTGFWYLKTPNKIGIKRLQKYSLWEF